MRAIDVRLGTLGDVDDAVSVYERSNLARRQGSWPSRSARVAQVTANLHDAAHHDTASWFLSLIYVLPERWGTGIGGMLLDAVIDEAKRRGCHRIFLWTHERQNERADRLYRSR